MLGLLGGLGGVFGLDPAKWAAKVVGGLVVILVAAALLLTSYCKGRDDGRAGAQLAQQKAVTAALERDRKAREQADIERVRDQVATADTKEELTDAIDDAADIGADPAVALACERLRRLPSRQRVSLPAECGPASGNSTQAGANR